MAKMAKMNNDYFLKILCDWVKKLRKSCDFTFTFMASAMQLKLQCSIKSSTPNVLWCHNSALIFHSAYYAGIIVRIIGDQFCKNNSRIIGRLRA